MLKWLAGLLLLSAAASARAAPGRSSGASAPAAPRRAIEQPLRLTVGATSELMGVLAPGQDALYFVSDASGTLDVMRQQPLQSAPVAVSSGLGDAIGPEISPDGKHLAYISFERDSTGDVCVRGLDSAGESRCFERPESAELQVLWWDNTSIALLSRRGLHGDFQFERAPIDGKPARSVLARNMVGLALSPDRRWLAYIPIDRATADVGVTFSQRTGVGIGLQRLTDGSPALEYVPRLPGASGSVAFAPGGDYLEFTQFLNDSNRDGAIDGDDNAVIFRVRFDPRRANPIDPDEEPEQLTSARWDCHYPAPTRRQLIASCSHEGSLDVYALPLAGAVPAEWNEARLAAESEAARDVWTRLLLAARRLVLAASPAAKEAIVRQALLWHLELGEYESVLYDAEHRLASPEARSFGVLLSELAQHRRADLALIQGQTSERYIQSERARAERLQAAAAESLALQQLRTLVLSEIEDDAGDKGRALQHFRALELSQLADPLLAPLVQARAERLYRLRGARAELLEVYRSLAGQPRLSLARRLEYAQRFVSELARGQKPPAREAALRRERDRVEDGSELALLLDVELALSGLDDRSQEDVRKLIFALYTENKASERRRALVLSTLRAAAKAGNEYLQYQFVTSWASSLRYVEPERKYAEALYNQIVLDRAYGEGRQGKLAESRGYFYAATVATDALEAQIGFIEAKLAQAGASANAELDQLYQKRYAKHPDGPHYAFVRAYRLARELPFERDPARHDAAVEQVVVALRAVAAALPQEPQVHQLWGFALHQRARRSGSRQAAVDANRQYLLALDLARGDERLTATLLHRLGILQAALGNHGLALRYFQQRDEYPHVRPLEELALRIGLAKSGWHRGESRLARDQLRAAHATLAARPELLRYRPLVLDRLGLALAANGEAPAAREQYRALLELLATQPEQSPLNRLKAQLGLAANALESAEPRTALGALSQAERVLEQNSVLEPAGPWQWNHSLIDDYDYTPLQYRALVAGLLAGAYGQLNDPSAALTAIQRRVQLLEERLAETEADEDRLELAQAQLHLAALQYRQQNLPAATAAVEHGLALSDTYNQNTGSELSEVQLSLQQAYAELVLYGRVPRAGLKRDPQAELQRSYASLCKYRNPRFSPQRFLFKTYLTELSLDPVL